MLLDCSFPLYYAKSIWCIEMVWQWMFCHGNKFALADLMSKLSKSEAEFKRNLIHVLLPCKITRYFKSFGLLLA